MPRQNKAAACFRRPAGCLAALRSLAPSEAANDEASQYKVSVINSEHVCSVQGISGTLYAVQSKTGENCAVHEVFAPFDIALPLSCSCRKYKAFKIPDCHCARVYAELEDGRLYYSEESVDEYWHIRRHPLYPHAAAELNGALSLPLMVSGPGEGASAKGKCCRCVGTTAIDLCDTHASFVACRSSYIYCCHSVPADGKDAGAVAAAATATADATAETYKKVASVKVPPLESACYTTLHGMAQQIIEFAKRDISTYQRSVVQFQSMINVAKAEADGTSDRGVKWLPLAPVKRLKGRNKMKESTANMSNRSAAAKKAKPFNPATGKCTTCRQNGVIPKDNHRAKSRRCPFFWHLCRRHPLVRNRQPAFHLSPLFLPCGIKSIRPVNLQ